MQELPSGFILSEKFEVGEKKGQGSLGEDIYHGRHLELDRDIVIRILPAEALMDDECTKRFMQGIKLAANLQHPNIIAVLDAGEENGLKFFVTNLEKGYYLNEYLEQRGQLEEHESIRIVQGLADALDYAWKEQQIIHRNVCPDTILIAKGNIPMLTDFALAKSLETDTQLTMQGYAVGDPAYMSPEQIKGEAIDFHSDIYCLGLVFYQLLAGHAPFKGESQMALMNSQVSEPHRPIQGANEHVTDACAAVIDKMLEKQLADRYGSWDDIVSDLDKILNNKAPGALQKGTTKEARDKIKREVETKMGKKHAKDMNKIANALAQDARRRFKRNILIWTIIVNAIIFAIFIVYMKNKNDKQQNTLPENPSNSLNLEN